MAISLKQVTSTFTAIAGTSLSLAYASNVVSGDLLIAVCGTGSLGANNLSSVTDSQGNLWTVVASRASIDSPLSVSIAWAVAGATGANTVTATFFAPAGSMDLIIAEYMGATGWAFDKKNTNFAGVPPDTTSTGSITTTVANEVLIVGSSLPADQTPGWNVSAGFTIQAQVNNTSPESMAYADQIVSATGTYSATIGGTGALASTEIVAAIASFSGTLSAPAAPVRPGGGGLPNEVWQQIRSACRPFTHYDWCLYKEMDRWRRIHVQMPCSVPRDLWDALPWSEEQASLPALARSFRPVSGIITPAPAAGDTPVITLHVPHGWDAILAGFYWRYNGLNFIEGSGDIFWRIRINQRFVKDLGNVGFTLGSPATPMPMTEGGQLLQTRQTVQILVNVPNISGTIQVGASRITAGLFGFFWPKGVSAWTRT